MAFQFDATCPWAPRGPALTATRWLRSCLRIYLSNCDQVNALAAQKVPVERGKSAEVSLCFPLFRRPNLVWGAGPAGGGLPGGSLLLDGSVAFHERWLGHHPKPWDQAGSRDGQTHQQLQTRLWLVRGQKHVALLVHCAKVSGKPLQWVSWHHGVCFWRRWVDANVGKSQPGWDVCTVK